MTQKHSVTTKRKMEQGMITCYSVDLIKMAVVHFVYNCNNCKLDFTAFFLSNAPVAQVSDV